MMNPGREDEGGEDVDGAMALESANEITPRRAPHEANWISVRLPAKKENLGVARLVVAALAAELPFTMAEVEEIKVAVSEAVTNVIRHAYPGGEGEFSLRAAIGAGELAVTIADEGRGLPEGAAPEPGESDAGLGFVFMRSLMDRVEVTGGAGRGTVVRLWKRPAQN